MLRTRLLTALWGIPLIIAAVYFDEPVPWFTVLLAAAGLLGAWEFFTMSGVRGYRPMFISGLAFTVLLVVQPHIPYEYTLGIVVVGGGLVTFGLTFLFPMPRVRLSWTWMMIGTIAIGWLLSLLVEVRLAPATAGLSEFGRNVIFLALFATFGSDTFAYFIGRAFGKHKMAPRVSPGKTWEGAAGGLLGGVIVAVVLSLGTPLRAFDNAGVAVLVGLLVSAFGQAGDLVESRLKRFFGVKDSGKIIPGHGGILDRIDSVVFAGLVAYIYAAFMVVGGL
jgi:phosphatidate cytidylyltransferase